MSITDISGIASIGAIGGGLVAAMKAAGFPARLAPLATAGFALVIGIVYEIVGWIPAIQGASPAAQYAAAAVIGLYSGLAWEGLTNTVQQSQNKPS